MDIKVIEFNSIVEATLFHASLFLGGWLEGKFNFFPDSVVMSLYTEALSVLLVFYSFRDTNI